MLDRQPKGLRKCSYGCKTLRRFLRQGMQKHSIDIGGQSGIKCTRSLWLNVKMLIHQLHRATLERWATSEQFRGHDSQRVLVRCGYRTTCPLFWGHIGGGPTNNLACNRGGRREFCNTEISEQHIRPIRSLLRLTNEQVGGLDILVNDLVIV
jgi:hypothetical protein